MEEKKQIEWVNIAKGLAMLMVVVGHVSYALPNGKLFPLQTLIVGWHVPIFFLIAGFFIKEERLEKPMTFVKSKIHSLYKPLLCYYIPAVILHNFLLEIGFYDTITEYGGKYMHYYGAVEMVKQVILSIFFAGREPILGAMWFVYVLFLAMCGFSIVSCGLRKIINDEKLYEWTRMVVLLILAILACDLTNMFGINIPRCNNTLIALWLIYCGFKLRNQVGVKFNCGWLALVSLLLIWHIAPIGGGNALNSNKLHDIVLLTIGSVAALYVTCFVSQKLEGSRLGRSVALCGRESFHIMALQFAAFKIGTLILSVFGVERSLAVLGAPTDGSLLLFIYYIFWGMVFPLLFMWALRNIKRLVQRVKLKN